MPEILELIAATESEMESIISSVENSAKAISPAEQPHLEIRYDDCDFGMTLADYCEVDSDEIMECVNVPAMYIPDDEYGRTVHLIPKTFAESIGQVDIEPDEFFGDVAHFAWDHVCSTERDLYLIILS